MIIKHDKDKEIKKEEEKIIKINEYNLSKETLYVRKDLNDNKSFLIISLIIDSLFVLSSLTFIILGIILIDFIFILISIITGSLAIILGIIFASMYFKKDLDKSYYTYEKNITLLHRITKE